MPKSLLEAVLSVLLLRALLRASSMDEKMLLEVDSRVELDTGRTKLIEIKTREAERKATTTNISIRVNPALANFSVGFAFSLRENVNPE
jgi:hypothetical protein